MPSDGGNKGPMDDATQIFWQVIDEAQEEWDRQAKMPDAEIERVGDAYLQARLVGKLATILEIAQQINPTRIENVD